MTRTFVMVAAMGLMLASFATAWSADVTPGPNYLDVSIQTSSGGEAETSRETDPSASPVSDQGADITYSHQLLCGDADQDLRLDTFACDSPTIRCGDGDRGLMYNVTAHLPDGSSEAAGTGCYLPQAIATAEASAGTAPPRITPAIVLRAFERVPLPESEVVVQPPGGQTLVGLDTIFSTEAEGFTETVTLLGRSVELDITPSSYRWSHGDSTEQTSNWPGARWTRGGSSGGYITHVYDDTARLATSVDTTWSARYRVEGGAWQDVPGTVTIEGESAPLRVRSASPHLVGVSDRG